MCNKEQGFYQSAISEIQSSDLLLRLKIGRHEYDITADDKFMDNGACVQLLTQNKNPASYWGRKASPIVSKRAQKQMSRFLRSLHSHDYGPGIVVFSLGKS